MAEYIERDALLEKAYCNRVRTANNPYGGKCVVDVYDIEAAPAADVAPVVHGRWLDNDDYDASVCSNCQTMWNNLGNDTQRFNFCPNCGADMREVADNG